MYCEESAMPSLVFVDADTTNWIDALGAVAPDHSTSSVASVCSLEESTPGFVPFTITVGVFAGNPNWLRKLWTSERFRLLRPATATDWPVPSIDCVYRLAES